MTDDCIPDPFKNYKPKANPAPLPSQSPPTALTEGERLDMLSNPEKLRTLAKSALIEIIANSAKTTALVPAIKELLDRIDGKPAQTQIVAMNVSGAVEHKIVLPATQRFLDSILTIEN